MDVKDKFLAAYDEDFEKRLPAKLLEEYYILECLSSLDGCDTLLAANKKTGGKFAAKCYTQASPLFNLTEPEQMADIENKAIPYFVGEYRNEEYRCVLREYVEGVSLHDYAKTNRLTEEKIVDISIKLAYAMKALHDMEPPVIHRDIKPQNVIIKEDGSIALIDLGISRIYKENENEDTIFYGTQYYAAPEQYGFMQTDVKSDIYSFGIVLSWMLTGKAKAINTPHTRLEKIACKCSEFAPDRRFKNDDALIAELLRATPEYARKHDRKLKSARIYAFVLVFIVALAGFAYVAAGNAGLFGKRAVKFKEPLIERAVREMLGKPSGVITDEELEGMTEIFIQGDAVLTSMEDFYQITSDWYDKGMVSGGITELSDLAKMPNLSVICIGGQQIKDISPLKNLTELETVELRNNEIEDISPIANKDKIIKTGFSFNKLTSIDALSTCKLLSSIDLREAGSFDGKPIETINGLSLLDITCDSDAYKYLDGKYVNMLKLNAPGQTDLECLRGVSEVKKLYIDWSEITDISALEGREDITYLNMSGCIIDDISPLFTMPALEHLEISAKIIDKFEAYASSNGIDYGFEVVVTE